MPRKAKELSALEVRRLTKPGRWSVGGVGGLALQVTASGAKSWVLRMPVGGRQREMGLGSFPAVSLADARESARAQREKLNLGTDPIAERHSAARAVAAGRELQQTFDSVSAVYIEQHEPSWKNPKHAGQWRSTLAFVYCWLDEHDLMAVRTEAEKYLMLAALNLVECVAFVGAVKTTR